MRAAAVLICILLTAPATAQQLSVVGGGGTDGIIAGGSVFVVTGDPGGFQFSVLAHQRDHLEVPIVLHIDVKQRGARATFIAFGPALLFRVRDHSGGGKVQAAFTAGGGYETGPLRIEARYTTGTRTFSLTAGFTFFNPRR
jgi:hypothetical protein